MNHKVYRFYYSCIQLFELRMCFNKTQFSFGSFLSHVLAVSISELAVSVGERSLYHSPGGLLSII